MIIFHECVLRVFNNDDLHIFKHILSWFSTITRYTKYVISMLPTCTSSLSVHFGFSNFLPENRAYRTSQPANKYGMWLLNELSALDANCSTIANEPFSTKCDKKLSPFSLYNWFHILSRFQALHSTPLLPPF